MTEIKKFKREYPYTDKDTGEDKVMKVTYTIVLNDGVINDIRNEYGFSIEKNSECWDFITTNIKH